VVAGRKSGLREDRDLGTLIRRRVTMLEPFAADRDVVNLDLLLATAERAKNR
jgi:hypothetical protein